jgi:prepilin-type N-terminal cleavage/methylation domain-containing protein/prepilin-type processing-associated H-X9-DG protein
MSPDTSCRRNACSRRGRYHCPAFTLIELLVVIAVIAVMAGLLLPVLAQARRKGVQTQCMSNLKQIGIGIQMFTDDNADILPGPLVAGARASYDITSSQELIFHIAGYLGDPVPSPQTVVSRVFRCPGYERQAPGLTSLIGRKVFLLNDDMDPDPAKMLPPFGYPLPPKTALPISRTELDNKAPASSVFAISDVDQSIPTLNPTVTWWTDLPNKPVHGSARNQLFFDWHVEAVHW